jgi:hypothetical protein
MVKLKKDRVNLFVEKFYKNNPLNYFTAVNNSIPQLVRVFATISHFYPSLILAGKAGAFPSVASHTTPL